MLNLKHLFNEEFIQILFNDCVNIKDVTEERCRNELKILIGSWLKNVLWLLLKTQEKLNTIVRFQNHFCTRIMFNLRESDKQIKCCSCKDYKKENYCWLRIVTEKRKKERKNVLKRFHFHECFF